MDRKRLLSSITDEDSCLAASSPPENFYDQQLSDPQIKKHKGIHEVSWEEGLYSSPRADVTDHMLEDDASYASLPSPFRKRYEPDDEMAEEQPCHSHSSSAQRSGRIVSFSDCNINDRVFSVVDIADSPSSNSALSTSEQDTSPSYDESVVYIDPDDQDSHQEHQVEYEECVVENSNFDGDEPDDGDSGVDDDALRSLEQSNDLSSNLHRWMGDEKDDYHELKPTIKRSSRQFSENAATTEQSEMIETLRSELEIYRQNSEWQDARIRYLEVQYEENNGLEYQLQVSKQLNATLEKKLMRLQQMLEDIPSREAELKRLKEKNRQLEDDKRSKEELGQTVSNLIDETTKLKTEISELTSIAGMLETENSTLKQRCERLEVEKAEEKAAYNALKNCNGDDPTKENCCIKVRELKEKFGEMLENEFKCSICEEMFIEATVTNCNHVFCAFCLREWRKKKNDCPHCRVNISDQCRATVIDEFLFNACKLISEKLFAERTQILNERKAQSHTKVTQTSRSKTSSGNGSVRLVPLANLRGAQGTPPALHSHYARSTSMLTLPLRNYLSHDYYGSNPSTATATATNYLFSGSMVPPTPPYPVTTSTPVSSSHLSPFGRRPSVVPTTLSSFSQRPLEPPTASLPSRTLIRRPGASSSPLMTYSPYNWDPSSDMPITPWPMGMPSSSASSSTSTSSSSSSPTPSFLDALNSLAGFNDTRTAPPAHSPSSSSSTLATISSSATPSSSSSPSPSSLPLNCTTSTTARSSFYPSFNNYDTTDRRVQLRARTMYKLQTATRNCDFISLQQIIEAEHKLSLKAKSEEQYIVATERLLHLIKERVSAARSARNPALDVSNILQMVQSV